jgi:hypothetical protein
VCHQPDLVFKGVVALSIWHRPRLKPAVKHLGDTLQVPLALLGWDNNVVNVLAVQVGDVSTTREALQLLDGADADDFFAVL